MFELMRTNDPVVLSLARGLLDEAGIMIFEADAQMSLLEGSIGAFPRRLMVIEADLTDARKLLRAEGLGEWLIEP